VTKIGELGTTQAATSNRRTLRRILRSVSKEHISYIIKVKRIGDLGTTLTATVFLRGVLRLLVTGNVVSNSHILVSLMMEETFSSKTSNLTRATRRNIVEDSIHHTILFIDTIWGFMTYGRK
jgi:hypothetical protein